MRNGPNLCTGDNNPITRKPLGRDTERAGSNDIDSGKRHVQLFAQTWLDIKNWCQEHGPLVLYAER